MAEALLKEAKERAGNSTVQADEGARKQASEAAPHEVLLPVSLSLTEKDRRHLLYKLIGWRDPYRVAQGLAHSLGLNEVEERVAAENLVRSVGSYARNTAQCQKRPEEIRFQMDVYVRQGDQAFRDRLEVDLCLAGVTSSLIGTVQNYTLSVCRDLGLDTNTWFLPITKTLYALLQDSAEDIGMGTGEVSLLPPLQEACQLIRSSPKEFPRVDPVDEELDAKETQRAKAREEKGKKSQR